MKKNAIALSIDRPPRPIEWRAPIESIPSPLRVLGHIAAAVPALVVLLALAAIVLLVLVSERGNDITDC